MLAEQQAFAGRKEQCKDILRKAEQERLANAVRRPARTGTELTRKIAAWLRASRVRSDPFPAPATPRPAPGR